jgi:4-nitrophenyl phosphatase
MDLRAVHAFIFDLDGCVYIGNTLVPGVQAVLQTLRERGRRILFLTNNSREAGEELQVKLVRLGISARREEILSAVEVAAPFVRDRFGPSRVLAIGAETLRRLLVDAGHYLVPLEAYRDAQVVVVGHDFDFDYRKLTAATRAVAGGAAFVAVNRDPRLPVEGGEFYPGCGTLVAAVAAAAGVTPEVWASRLRTSSEPRWPAWVCRRKGRPWWATASSRTSRAPGRWACGPSGSRRRAPSRAWSGRISRFVALL